MQLRGRRIPRDPDRTETVSAAPHVLSQCNGLPPGPASPPPLSPLWRLYLYSLHGLLCELLFTSLWDYGMTRDPRLLGHSSLWALPMYSGALLGVEGMAQWLADRSVTLPLRLLVYTSFIYIWEFAWGTGLSLLGACPWDYSGFRYNFKGVVTLEYAPFWAAGALVAEKWVIRNTLRAWLR